MKSEDMKKKYQDIQSAFTLIEVVIATFILVTGIMGAFAVIQQVTAYVSTSSDRLIAAYLTQEGIEIVRNIRDGNWLKNFDWKTGLTGCEAPLGCEADYNDRSLTSYGGRYLKLNDRFYNYNSGADTKFKRKIIVTPAIDPDGADILKVVVSVEWKEKGSFKLFSAQENLYNWK
ncbi:MAG: hypothetical protein Q7S82_02270 [bacterium]|nr:hypothetical protein [bacterium]